MRLTSARGAYCIRFPVLPILDLWRHRELIVRLAEREIAAKYRGATLGMFWAVAVPLLMLSTYTFVFAFVLSGRWAGHADRPTDFALLLFCGLAIFTPFAEILNRAPRLIIDNAVYVKKVVFPLQVLPAVASLTALFNAVVSVAILIVFLVVARGVPPATAVLAPVIYIPVLLMMLGAGWFMASLGVFFRDVTQFTGVVTTLLMFLSPIFYPIEAVPEQFRGLLAMNPLAPSIQGLRDVVFFGRLPDPTAFAVHLLGAWVFACLGHTWFVRTQRAFADVV